MVKGYLKEQDLDNDLKIKINDANNNINNHKDNIISHIPYSITTGSANTYIVTLTPALTSYVEGMAISVKINVDNTGASTININELGVKSIKKSKW